MNARLGQGGLPTNNRPNKIHADISFHLKLAINFNKMFRESEGPHIHVSALEGVYVSPTAPWYYMLVGNRSRGPVTGQ